MLLQLPLHAGWLADPGGTTIGNPFAGGHAWAVDVVGEAIWAGEWPDPTDAAGFPLERRARYVAWAVLLLGGLLRPVLLPLASINLATLLGPALGAASMVALVRTLQPKAHALGLTLAGLLYGLAPVTLGAALSGQVENTQSWVLPLMLWVLAKAAARPPWLLAVLPLWMMGAGTSPYLAMMAGIALPWVAWQVGLLRAAVPAGLAILGVLGVRAWISADSFHADEDLFKPAYSPDSWPPVFTDPLTVADLDTLLVGITAPQPKAFVVHQPYLGLVLLLCCFWLGRERRRWLYPALAGTLLALGPELAWDMNPIVVADRHLPGPGVVARWLNLPLAHGGQYYRCTILAVMGLAGMLAAARRPRWLGVLGVLAALDAVRSVAIVGLPWITHTLPHGAWDAWDADPVPGAVLHLPMASPHIEPCHPIRLAGRSEHHRALSDTPRGQVEPPGEPTMATAFACTTRGQGCALPELEDFGTLGFRYVVLDLPDVPERKSLRKRMVRAWGNPVGAADGLEWWTAGDTAP